MFVFQLLFILIFSFTFKSVTSIIGEVKLWNITAQEIQKITDSVDDKILSYSWNEVTGAELYFIQNKTNTYFFFKDDSTNQKFSQIYDDLIEIESPLFLYKSTYYFCTSLPALMYINENSIKKINNPSEVNNKKSTLKCLRGPDENSILVAFLKTEYLCFFNLADNNFFCNTINRGNSIAINYFHDKNVGIYELTVITEKEKNTTYNVLTVKYQTGFHILNEKEKQLILFSKVELSTILYYEDGTVISFIFTYEPNTENFHLYRLNLGNDDFYEFKFLYLFKNFNIAFAKYLGDNTLLCYSIKSSVPDINQNYKSYIGVIDIEYNFGLFNIESDVKEKLYFNNKTYDKDIKLIYFMKNTKTILCPFINQNGLCSNELESNKFVVSKNNSLFYNYFSEECPENFTDFGNYCYYNCTDGFYINKADNNKCTFCPIDYTNNWIFSIISKQCISPQHCEYYHDETTCYDCEIGEKMFFNNDCIVNCQEIHLVPNGTNLSDCITCEDKYPDNKHYFSIKEGNCTLCENGVKDDNKKLCSECKYNDDGNHSYFKLLDKCIPDCRKYYSVDVDSVCTFCEDNYYYEEGQCSFNSCQSRGYGIEEITLNFEKVNKALNICILCKNNTINENNIYLQNKYCTDNCQGEYKKIAADNICVNCKESESFFFINTQDCMKNCPDKAKVDKVSMTCGFCPEDQFFYQSDQDPDDKQCLQQCKENQEPKEGTFKNINYKYCADLKCEDNQIFINGSCQDCSGQFYSPSNSSCYKCFCWSDKENKTEYHCNVANGQCFCPDKYYGYSCEFYSEEGNEEMTIITLNNRLIKSSKNYFTHILSNKTTLSDEYDFTWKVFFNDIEISDNETYKKYFITALNEKIFGINKEIFDEKDNTIHISLNIARYNRSIYYSKIRLNIIELIEEISNFKSNYNDININEMNTHLNIKLTDRKEKYLGRYEFQYGLVDENNERLPLTDYIGTDQVDLNLICPINFGVNIRNDRGEEKNYLLQKVISCNPSNFTIDDIINGTFYRSEKIFLLKSYLKSKRFQKSEKLDNIINFVNDIINEAINKDGSYIEPKSNPNLIEEYTRNLLELENNPTDLNITYSEPKNIFSLMNHLLNYRKKYLNKEYVLSFFNSFSLLFENIFTKDNISNKTLSNEDIKSLFRTIDNLYDIIIEKNITNNKETLFYDNFIEVLENLSRYLSYKTYPSETIRLIGKRISLLTYNLGVHQKNNNISFPYITKKENFYINNFSNYSFDNYDMNQEICSQEISTFFCFTKDNYNDFIDKLNKSYENLNINNLTLNIFLMEEMKKNTRDEKLTYDGPDGEQEYQRIILKNNHTVIFRLINRTENFPQIINNNNMILEFDLEFPFYINNNDNKKDKQEIDSNLKPLGFIIPLSPDYKNFACLPKSYYDDNNTYYCFTHFGFEKNSTRCKCKTKLNDEIIIVENDEIASFIKDKQFKKSEYELNNKYGLWFAYIFILLLLIPTIYYLLSDIIKDSKDLKKNNIIDFEVDRKTTYNGIKKYCNTGIFVFSLYLTLRKFPYFSPFNKYNKRYPRFIKHLIIIMGLLIGFILSLLPFIWISFRERENFMNQRSVEYSDDSINNIKPDSYFSKGILFGIFGYIFANLFIYIFSKILNFEKEEIDIWLDIKTMCKDYIYYEIKSEVLLGPIWNKIKSRMMAYYYICGDYYSKIRQKNKFSNYLDQISRIQIGRKTVMPELSEVDRILPRTTNGSELASVLDINSDSKSNNKKDNKAMEMTNKEFNEPLLDNEGNENKLTSLNLNNNKTISNDNIQGLKIRRTDNFSLDNIIISDEKTKRQIEHFTKVRNKYIYINKRKDANEIEIDERSNDGDENIAFNISPQFNYVYFPSNSFTTQGNNFISKEDTKDIYNFILISVILFVIFACLLTSLFISIHEILIIFGDFIINAWIIPLIIIFTVVSFLLYFIKILIGSFLLFHFYHWRKKGWFYRILYLVFVDQSMIYVYKVRNLITKYKKEFDYL